MLQAHRKVSLSFLSSVFPQPIQYESRKRNLQRFLLLPQLSIKLLWFPLVKYWLRQEESGKGLNRALRRHRKKLSFQEFGYWLVAIDRTEWKGRNIFMVSLVWGTHALPLYWEILGHVGNSDLRTQKRLLTAILPLFKRSKLLVLADREFHSPKFADWLNSKGLSFALRQKNSLHFTEAIGTDYQSLKSLGLQPGESKFYSDVFCNKEDGLGPFNLALYWKRKYRKKGPKEAWFILTNLTDLKTALALYRCRWGIEQLFKDCKSGGFNMEDTKLNDTRFIALLLIIAIAYSLATLQGYSTRQAGLDSYVGKIQEHKDKSLRQSDFSLGLYGQRWGYAMDLWPELALALISLKPHKSLCFQRGFFALSLIRQAS